MLDHIVKHQNSYVYSYLFEDNFVQLMEKGIEVSGLLNSRIFCHEFDFQEWPTVHADN